MNHNAEDVLSIVQTANKQISRLHPQSKYFLNFPIQYNAVISETELSKYEDFYNIELPRDYREFVKNVGNGGNQPVCGMFSVQESLAINSRFVSESIYLSSSELVRDYGKEYRLLLFKKDLSDAENTLDDYYNYETGEFRYQYLFYDDHESYVYYMELMKMHLLIFSFNEGFPVEYAIALDGVHKGKVVYYSDVAKGRNIKLTGLSFIDWIYEYYNHALECRKGFFTAMNW